MPANTDKSTKLQENFLKLYQQLNPMQKQAVDTTEGPVMVLAGPGTGKTQILAMRIAYILNNPDLQVNPSNILCLTFTDSGVNAMRQRLMEIIGTEAYHVRIHTFHSFCNEVIREESQRFSGIKPIADLDSIEIFNEIIDSLDPNSPIKPFGDQYHYRSTLMAHIKNLKKESITVSKLEEVINNLEKFLDDNADLIEAFVAKNARSIKESDRDLFLEHLFVRNNNTECLYFVQLIQSWADTAEKMTDFKTLLRKFCEDNRKAIPKLRELLKVYAAYTAKLTKNKLYDFEDMILRVIAEFESDENLLADYQEQYQYILVDEYQDTNGSQSRILELLCSYYQDNPNIFVVGDDDQSIYRFQGASQENAISFSKRYQANITLLALENNYRSQQNILDLASLLIVNNNSRINKSSQSLQSSGKASTYSLAPIVVRAANSPVDELYIVGKQIQELIKQGTPASEIAVLFRRNKDALPVADMLSRMGIAFRVEAGDNVLENIEITQLIDLLKVITNPYANAYLLFNLLNYNWIQQSQYLKGVTPLDIFKANLGRQSKDKTSFVESLAANEKFTGFVNAILQAHQQDQNLKVDILLEKLVKDFGYLGYILKQPDYIIHINRLEALFKTLRGLYESPLRGLQRRSAKTLESLTLADFLRHVQLLQDNDLEIKMQNSYSAQNAVRLMTAHKSKGLEFDHVFIYGLTDKIWSNEKHRELIKFPPGLLSETQSQVDIEDDSRRLFYVAITRAKQSLHLSYHVKDDKDKGRSSSMFLTELQYENNNLISYYKSEDCDSADLENALLTKFADRQELFADVDKSFITEILVNYKMSPTHLQNYLDCPRKFFYQNLLRIPAAKQRSASLGTAVHRALHDLFRLKLVAKPNAEEFLLKQFEEYLIEEHLSETDHIDSLGHGKKILGNYYKHYAQQFHTETLLEWDFAGMGLNLDGISLTGKIDKVEIFDNNNVNVVDYKTGNPGTKSKELKAGGSYYRQIVFYNLLCDLAYRSGQSKYKMTSGELDFIEPHKDKNTFMRERINVTEQDLEDIKQEITTSYKAITEQCFDKTDDLEQCSYCQFATICGR